MNAPAEHAVQNSVALDTQEMQTHFPVNVLVRQYKGTEAVHAGVATVVRALEAELRDTDRNAAANGDSTTRGGFQTPADIQFLDRSEDAVRELRQRIIYPGIEQYLQDVWQVNPYLTPFTVKSWANILRRGNWQAPHMHPTEFTIISGVYYVDVPAMKPPSGCIEFINPHPISVALGGQMATQPHQPRAGQMLLFPPYYMHYVHPLEEDVERIVVAFDVRLQVQQV